MSLCFLFYAKLGSEKTESFAFRSMVIMEGDKLANMDNSDLCKKMGTSQKRQNPEEGVAFVQDIRLKKQIKKKMVLINLVGFNRIYIFVRT